jgi:hypothetical protein
MFKAAAEDGTVAEATRTLERAGFLVRVASASPLRIIGGTSRSEGPPPVVYSGGFCLTEKDGSYALSSTSRWGRTIDETSYDTLPGAVDALVRAFGEAPRSPDVPR